MRILLLIMLLVFIGCSDKTPEEETNYILDDLNNNQEQSQ